MSHVVLADDCGLVDVGCHVRSSVHDWLSETALSMARGAARIVAEAMTWWTQSDRTSMLRSPAIGHIHALLWFTSLAVLTGSVMWQGFLLMWRRKPDPLISVGTGLLAYVGWSTLGTTAAVAVNEAGIALSADALRSSIEKFAATIGAGMAAEVNTSVAIALLLAIVLFLLGVVQWVLGFFRMGALVILLALLPVAAAGQVTEATRPWLRKVLSWCLSLLLYQPMAAIVFSIGFLLTGTGKSLSAVLVGMAVLALAVIAMPTMMRFFSWGPGMTTGSSGGGGAGLAMGAAASVLGGSAGAAGYARYMDENGPATGGTGGTGALTVHPAHSASGPGDDARAADGASGGATVGSPVAAPEAAGSPEGAVADVAGAAAGPSGAVLRSAHALGHQMLEHAVPPESEEPAGEENS